MPAQRVHILDPDGELAKVLGPHEENARIPVEGLEPLLDLLERETVPAASVLDARRLPDAARERLARTPGGRHRLMLVVVETREQGLAWLEAGATDFTSPEAREIEVRYARLLALREALLSSGNGPSSPLVRSVLHDMRNHLNCMFGYLDLLAQENDSSRMRMDLEQVSENTERILELCRTLQEACQDPGSEAVAPRTR